MRAEHQVDRLILVDLADDLIAAQVDDRSPRDGEGRRHAGLDDGLGAEVERRHGDGLVGQAQHECQHARLVGIGYVEQRGFGDAVPRAQRDDAA